MGIKDLLRFMKPYVEPIHIKKYADKRVGIDAYSWLHKGAYSCSMELCLNMEGDKKFQYVNYCLHRINMLRHYNITPVLVFDGGNIPCKALTEQQRHSKRKDNRKLAMAKLKDGDINAATEMFQRAVSITPSMAHQLILILRSENIEFVVAPYEADAQLAYLSSLDADKGGIDAVISEDSDLLAYGCSSVIFKMDRYGNGEEIVMSDVFDSVGRAPSFLHFDKELFTGMCVLAGCDFLPSVPGIGIAKAHGLVLKYRNLDRVLSVLKYEKGNQMPNDYFISFKEALAVFQHARIYDADSKRLKHLTPLRETLVHYSAEELDFLGPELSSSQASAIAQGELDPCTSLYNGQLKKPIAVNNTSERLSSTQPPNRILKQETTTEGCLTIVSSHKTGTKRITVMDKTKPKSSLEQLSNLKQLISPLNHSIPSRIQPDISAKRSSLVPDNNPFKRLRQTQKETIVMNESATEHSEVKQVEDLETTPGSQKSVEPKTVMKKRVSSGKKIEGNKNTILNFFSRV
ncbi:hypothetical protein L1987_48535 [Smallanthus sonchifolius]|uniref:Uncharacterized protein n=1 Tax=Smallanthus sonchifolius TaxID=185202 RepID=A0ACB9FRK8_9ASTR|nr:hypothetical protein L1987_48535 [Smallanthus sonchifolius]